MSVIVLAVAVALPAKAQMSGQFSSPAIAFRSTSMMAGSGSAYSSSPTLNENGIATYSGESESSSNQAPSGPRRMVTPGAGGTQQPIGDALLPLLLMAMLFTGTVYYRRKKTVVKS